MCTGVNSEILASCSQWQKNSRVLARSGFYPNLNLCLFKASKMATNTLTTQQTPPAWEKYSEDMVIFMKSNHVAFCSQHKLWTSHFSFQCFSDHSCHWGTKPHLHTFLFFFFVRPIQTKRKSFIQSCSLILLSVDSEFNTTSKTFPLPQNFFPFLLFYSLLKLW